jgi:hypothetical protein
VEFRALSYSVTKSFFVHFDARQASDVGVPRRANIKFATRTEKFTNPSRRDLAMPFWESGGAKGFNPFIKGFVTLHKGFMDDHIHQIDKQMITSNLVPCM